MLGLSACRDICWACLHVHVETLQLYHDHLLRKTLEWPHLGGEGEEYGRLVVLINSLLASLLYYIMTLWFSKVSIMGLTVLHYKSLALHTILENRHSYISLGLWFKVKVCHFFATKAKGSPHPTVTLEVQLVFIATHIHVLFWGYWSLLTFDPSSNLTSVVLQVPLALAHMQAEYSRF